MSPPTKHICRADIGIGSKRAHTKKQEQNQNETVKSTHLETLSGRKTQERNRFKKNKTSRNHDTVDVFRITRPRHR